MISVNIQSSILISGIKKIYFDPINRLKTNDADYIFITHTHYDHFSPEDILKIKKADTIIIGPYDILNKCIELGFSRDSIILVKPCESYVIDDIEFKTVLAYNLNKTFHPKDNNWVGYVLNYEGVCYYVAGDTDVIAQNTQLKVDVAFVPIGGVYTMDALEAADFVNKLCPKMVIPIHYGMVVGGLEDLKSFKKNVSKNIEVKELI